MREFNVKLTEEQIEYLKTACEYMIDDAKENQKFFKETDPLYEDYEDSINMYDILLKRFQGMCD